MKLYPLNDPATFVTLSNDLIWDDEFGWTPLVSTMEYSVTGALVIDQSMRQAGRPITLTPAQEDMAWTSRSVLKQLYEWAKIPLLELVLELQYPNDTRQFTVSFRPGESEVLTHKPVKGFPGMNDEDQYLVSIKLIQI